MIRIGRVLLASWSRDILKRKGARTQEIKELRRAVLHKFPAW